MCPSCKIHGGDFVHVNEKKQGGGILTHGKSVSMSLSNGYTGGKPRNYHEIVLTYFCSQATSGTRRGSFQAENWIKKGWCHFHFCFILQLRTNNGEIRQCGSV